MRTTPLKTVIDALRRSLSDEIPPEDAGRSTQELLRRKIIRFSDYDLIDAINTVYAKAINRKGNSPREETTIMIVEGVTDYELPNDLMDIDVVTDKNNNTITRGGIGSPPMGGGLYYIVLNTITEYRILRLYNMSSSSLEDGDELLVVYSPLFRRVPYEAPPSYPMPGGDEMLQIAVFEATGILNAKSGKIDEASFALADRFRVDFDKSRIRDEPRRIMGPYDTPEHMEYVRNRNRRR